MSLAVAAVFRLVRRGFSTDIQVDRNGQGPDGFASLATVENVSIAQLRSPSNFVF